MDAHGTLRSAPPRRDDSLAGPRRRCQARPNPAFPEKNEVFPGGPALTALHLREAPCKDRGLDPIMKESIMDKTDILVKGVPKAILSMFQGFCTMEGKSEGEGIIDCMIDFIDKNTAGDKANFKKVVSDYRASIKKK
jgi:hypothetical protein